MCPSWDEFERLPAVEVSALVQQAGPQVCVFPFDGTRRWLTAEYPGQDLANEEYVHRVLREMARVFGLLFDLGVSTVVAPMVGPDLWGRGQKYLEMGAAVLPLFANGKEFSRLYDDKDVRVRFYGDYRSRLAGTVCSRVPAAFDECTQYTLAHESRRLFWGIFGQAQPALDFAAGFSVRFHASSGRVPSREEIVTAYYGELVGLATLYIGFGPFAVFDYPFLGGGDEDLYFTASPSPYIEESTVRCILYDHLFARPGTGNPEYAEMGEDDWEQVRGFYRLNRDVVLGVGKRGVGNLWFPVADVRGDVE